MGIFSPEAAALYEELGLDSIEPGTFSREEIAAWPPQIKQVYAQMMRGFQQSLRKTAEARKEIDDRTKKIEGASANVAKEAEQLYSFFDDERFAEFVKAAEGDPPPGWDFEGQIRYQVAKLLKGYHEAMAGKREEIATARAAAAREAELAAARSELRAFADANPDFLSYRDKIIAYRKEHPSVPAQDVYWLLKSREGRDRASAVDSARRASAGVGRPEAASTTVSGGLPDLEGAELAQWLRDNPEAHKRHLEHIRRRRA